METYKESQIEKIESELETYSEFDLEQQYREMLSENGPAIIGGYEYDQADALQSVDPVAYREGLADFISFCLEEHTEYRPGHYVLTEDLENLFS